MADVLLLEPSYSNKYPPIGLMKISYFHKYIHHDYVRFAKGKLPDAFKDKKWDRVYVTTLFTFEWERTKQAIEYALTVVKDPKQVYTGGILATLMPDLITSTFPTVKNNTGLLNKAGTLGLDKEECIDTLTLDYGILDDIAGEYTYPAHDAYFTYMTRGCGMKCEFCAVQTLEPEYYPYISIKDSIRKVDEQFGPKKDLLLMDNNVLRSPRFDEIIDEIKELGFAKGATYINPKTGNRVRRFVDFNQGLDAFLLNEHKAKRLGELALRPARIAFDHIEDVEAYKKAISLCARNGITHMSNYLLYNGIDFKGKGHEYNADTPEDLFERMRISMDLCEDLNNELDYKIAIFSFPMRYIPLSDTKRGFIGTKWNAKYLRALQRMLIPTQGKGVSSRSYFETDFGKTAEEFVMNLAMPEEHLGWRGHFVEKKDETPNQRLQRRKVWEDNQRYLEEWKRLFCLLGESKDRFMEYIGDNEFSCTRFKQIEDPLHKKLFLHYLTIPNLLKSLLELDENDRDFVIQYITKEFSLMYERILQYLSNGQLPFSILEAPYKYFGKSFVSDIFKSIDLCCKTEPLVINNLIKIQNKTKIHIFDYKLVKTFFLFRNTDAITEIEAEIIWHNIVMLNERNTRELLAVKFDAFKNKFIEKAVEGQLGSDYIREQAEKQIDLLVSQLSLFGK